MFGSIARRYDLANHLLSCGCDFIWRRRAAEIVAGWNPQTILDLATGTGDLALALAKERWRWRKRCRMQTSLARISPRKCWQLRKRKVFVELLQQMLSRFHLPIGHSIV